MDINIICSSYKRIRAESYSREEFIKNYKSLSEKYKLDNKKKSCIISFTASTNLMESEI